MQERAVIGCCSSSSAARTVCPAHRRCSAHAYSGVLPLELVLRACSSPHLRTPFLLHPPPRSLVPGWLARHSALAPLHLWLPYGQSSLTRTRATRAPGPAPPLRSICKSGALPTVIYMVRPAAHALYNLRVARAAARPWHWAASCFDGVGRRGRTCKKYNEIRGAWGRGHVRHPVC